MNAPKQFDLRLWSLTGSALPQAKKCFVLLPAFRRAGLRVSESFAHSTRGRRFVKCLAVKGLATPWRSRAAHRR